MKAYKELRAQFKEDVLAGNCYCILSGLKIENIKDLSLEHLTPKCRVSYGLSTQEQNIFPAFKVINGIKSGALFCEWMQNREKLLRKALKSSNIKKHEKEIIRATIENIPFYNINPCSLCILSEYCENAR